MQKVQFESCRWQMDKDGGWLCLRLKSEKDAARVCESVNPGKLYDAEIKEHRERRSLDANAYAWVLIGKLAEHYGIPPEDVYRQQIQNIGGVYTVTPIREDLVERFSRSWCAGHIGRMTDDLGECRNTRGYHNIRVWFGSSDYDTRQMSQLIDAIVQECQLVSIETQTPDQLADLKSRWEAADAR